METLSAVYIVTNAPRGTLYIGVTSHLVQRIWQHRAKVVPGFTARYGLSRLVWFEAHQDMREAIRREKRLKRYRRDWKVQLIEQANPHWIDLYPSLIR